MSMESYGLYIHIPFCLRRCLYCDFVSCTGKGQVQADYIDALIREIDQCKAKELDTVYIGGGTPSCIDAALIVRVLDACRSRFRLLPGAEISMEANPATLTGEKLELYRRAGVNRISMGVQSLCDSELSALGRLHTAQQARESYRLLRGSGFDNINLDVMFGIPGQTLSSFRATLEGICELAPQHISAYSLILEEGTRLFEMQCAGVLDLPDEDTERAMYELAIDLLGAKGYAHYEISNFAKPGCESRHNLKYWTCRPYIGLGAAAHSYNGAERYSNTSGISEYIARLKAGESAVEERLLLTGRDAMTEYIIMGLRICKGIELAGFEARFHQRLESLFAGEIEKYQKLGLMQVEDGRLYLTREGLSVSNSILCDFV